jgi:HlyD family secretion protein
MITLSKLPKPAWVALGLLVLILVISSLFPGNSGETDGEQATFTVESGPLVIDISEAGTISAQEQTIIKNELPSSTTIIYLIPEGTKVKKGDLLVELDSHELQEQRFEQFLKVKRAEAAYTKAVENKAISINKASNDVETAELDLTFAIQDREKYEKGDYPKQLHEASAKIALAKEDLQRAEDQLKWSRVLYDDKFISSTELQADELAYKRASLDLELAEGDLEMLETYTHQRQTLELESAVKQARSALERKKRESNAELVKVDVDLEISVTDLDRQKEKLDEIDAYLKQTKLYAPSEGMVVYATSVRTGRWGRSDDPLAEGQAIRKHQELIYLPATERAMATVKIHETNIDQVIEGMPARITVDAVPGRVFSGTITRIAPLADPTSVWLNPDLKVFDTRINIDGDGSALRNGMTCKVQIVIEQHDDVLAVPVQAVVREGKKSVVYLANGKGGEPRDVEVGMDNNRMVHILSGLKAGDEIMLTPPLSESSLPQMDTPVSPAPAGPDMQPRAAGKPGETIKPEQNAVKERPKGKPAST